MCQYTSTEALSDWEQQNHDALDIVCEIWGEPGSGGGCFSKIMCHIYVHYNVLEFKKNIPKYYFVKQSHPILCPYANYEYLNYAKYANENC